MTLPVSVVIPCKDMPDTVDRAIQSALDAGSSDVVVIDDGSAEPIALGTDDPRVRLYRFDVSVGVCGARNYGITNTMNELIVPLDADDELLPDALQILSDAWQDNTLVYGGYIEQDYEWGATCIDGPPTKPEIKHLAPPATLLHRKSVAHATWLFHADDWLKVEGYDPDFNIGAEDEAFMIALISAGVQPVRVTNVVYRKHIYPNTRTDAARSRYPFIQQLLREKYPSFFA